MKYVAVSLIAGIMLKNINLRETYGVIIKNFRIALGALSTPMLISDFLCNS